MPIRPEKVNEALDMLIQQYRAAPDEMAAEAVVAGIAATVGNAWSATQLGAILAEAVRRLAEVTPDAR